MPSPFGAHLGIGPGSRAIPRESLDGGALAKSGNGFLDRGRQVGSLYLLFLIIANHGIPEEKDALEDALYALRAYRSAWQHTEAA